MAEKHNRKGTGLPPKLHEARDIMRRWHSCTTDRDRHVFVRTLRKSRPEMAERFAKLIEA